MGQDKNEMENNEKGGAEMTTPYSSSSPAHPVQEPVDAPNFYTENAGNAIAFASNGIVGCPPNVAAVGVPIVQPLPIVQQTVHAVPNGPTTQDVQNVTVVYEESCCNVYWVLFVVGILLFPPLFICGSFGVCSSDKQEQMGGIANAIALTVYVVIIIALVAIA